jgi:hypothetical protein
MGQPEDQVWYGAILDDTLFVCINAVAKLFTGKP